MTHRTSTQDIGGDSESIPTLEWDAHSVWALAYGLKHQISIADPAELEAVRGEFIEAANMILAAVERRQ